MKTRTVTIIETPDDLIRVLNEHFEQGTLMLVARAPIKLAKATRSYGKLGRSASLDRGIGLTGEAADKYELAGETAQLTLRDVISLSLNQTSIRVEDFNEVVCEDAEELDDEDLDEEEELDEDEEG